MRTDIQPINDDFTGKILGNAAFARGADTANQTPDIFRVGDIVKYPTQEDTEASYLEVGSIEYTNGIDFVAEDTSVSYTHLRSPRDGLLSRMPSSA